MPRAGDQIQQLQQSLSSFQQQLQTQSNLFNTGFFNSLFGIMGELDNQLKKLSKASQKNDLHFSMLKRGGIIHDFKVFQGFLGGIVDKVKANQNPQVKSFVNETNKFMTKISGFIEHLTSHIILSQTADTVGMNDNYVYWQVPYAVGEKTKTVDILIKKEKKGQKNQFNPDNTKLILKFETDNMGQVGRAHV